MQASEAQHPLVFSGPVASAHAVQADGAKQPPWIGGSLIHPVAIGLTCLWWQNDHVWKFEFGNWLTGKLSDVCGLAITPLLLLSYAQLLGCCRPLTRLHVALAMGVVGILFSAINLSESCGYVYEECFAWLLSLVHGERRGVSHVVDAQDLWTLPGLGLAWWLSRKYTVSTVRMLDFADAKTLHTKK